MADKSEFTWVKTHQEIVQYLKHMKDRQPELISELEKAGVDKFTDRDVQGNAFKLDEIEPFTFFFYIYKYGEHKRLQILQNIARNLGFFVPSDTDGVPSANAISVRIFPQKDIRIHDEVNRLWALFHKAITHEVNDDDFQDVLQIVSLARAKLTEALFMVDPEYYLCIDGQTSPYLKEVLGIEPSFNTYSEYMAILQRVKNKTDMPFPELSHKAWLWNTNKANYWVFQGNPDIYDIVGALKELAVTNWRVASHGKEIKIGDKIILWVTGKEAGCYALGEVAGEIEYDVRDIEKKRFYKDNSYDVPHNRVPIQIIHNLVESPILKEQIAGIKELAELQAGLQGTNFTATKEQYEAFEIIIKGGNSRRYWLYSPGEEAKAWEDFYFKGIMGIGWHKLGDLAQYKSKKEIENKLKEIGETTISKSNDSLANWEFKTVMSPGDVVIAKKGRQTLLGYGVVTSDYYFDPAQVEFQSCRKVLWLKKGEWKNTSSTKLHIKTLTDISKYDSDRPDRDLYYEELLEDMGVDLPLVIPGGTATPMGAEPPRHQDQKYPLNLILYGPPGTGKTYNSINLAVQVIDPEFMSKITDMSSHRAAITTRYRQLVKEGRIVFTTFHQSMSYEDFIEGIKPITNEDQENSLSYEVVPGIFKSMCDRAALSDDNNFEQSYAKLITELASSEDDFMKIKTPSGKEFGISLNSNNNLNLHLGAEFRQNACLTKEIMIAYILGKEIPEYFKGYYQGVISLLKDKYGFDNKRVAGSNFVLIIDEINRGNVSQIFGELITLIEPDKRTGNPEAIEITLPYSKERFSVPSNLYIIGTMNTADRSVEALDTALRRRFSFREISPDCDLLADYDYKGISLQVLLEKINHRIEGLLDKDHTIGHSYFLRVARKETSLKTVFFNEIIPLLQEYFYGNFGRIELVLGSGFVKPFTYKLPDFASASHDNDGWVDSIQYRLVGEDQIKNEDDFVNALRILMNEK